VQLLGGVGSVAVKGGSQHPVHRRCGWIALPPLCLLQRLCTHARTRTGQTHRAPSPSLPLLPSAPRQCRRAARPGSCGRPASPPAVGPATHLRVCVGPSLCLCVVARPYDHMYKAHGGVRPSLWRHRMGWSPGAGIRALPPRRARLRAHRSPLRTLPPILSLGCQVASACGSRTDGGARGGRDDRGHRPVAIGEQVQVRIPQHEKVDKAQCCTPHRSDGGE
jgi:hypothetical protein